MNAKTAKTFSFVEDALMKTTKKSEDIMIRIAGEKRAKSLR